MLKILHNFVPFGENLLVKIFLPLENVLRECLMQKKKQNIAEIFLLFSFIVSSKFEINFFDKNDKKFKAKFNF